QSIAVLREVSAPRSIAYPLLYLGELCLAQGQRDAACTYLQEARALADQIGDLQAKRLTQAVLVEHEVLEGRPGVARERLTPLLDRPGQRERHVTWLLALLAWAQMESDQAEAKTLTAQRNARAREQRHRLVLLDVLRIQALLAMQQDRGNEATEALDEALTLSRDMGYPYAEAKALYVYGLSHQAREEPEPARECFEAALAICARLGERFYAAQVERSLACLATK